MCGVCGVCGDQEDLTFELVTARDERYLVTLGSADKKQVWLKEVKDLVHRLKPKGGATHHRLPRVLVVRAMCVVRAVFRVCHAPCVPCGVP